MSSDVFSGQTKLEVKDFFFKVLSGSAQGILIGVLPSAVMKYVLKYSGLMTTEYGQQMNAILTLFTSFIPLLIGVAIAMQFKMKPLDVGVIGIATGAGAGSIKWGAVADKADPTKLLYQFAGEDPTKSLLPKAGNLFVAQGAGDVINAMIIAGVAVLVTWLIAKYLNGFGSVAIILSPIFVGGGIALFGRVIAPYVAYATTFIGEMIQSFTELAPLPMTMLIAMAFSIIIITPVSTVGVALAISLSGIGSGAAAVGVVATTVILLVNSIQVNKKGVSVAIALGAMKGMMPSVFKKPIMMISFLVASAIAAIPVSIFNIQGTPTSAGFGWIGLVSPIQSMVADQADKAFMTNTVGIVPMLITWFVLPIVAGVAVNFLFTKIIKLYSANDFQQDL